MLWGQEAAQGKTIVLKTPPRVPYPVPYPVHDMTCTATCMSNLLYAWCIKGSSLYSRLAPWQLLLLSDVWSSNTAAERYSMSNYAVGRK